MDSSWKFDTWDYVKISLLLIIMKLFTCFGGVFPALTHYLGEPQQSQSHFWVLGCRAGLRWLQEM